MSTTKFMLSTLPLSSDQNVRADSENEIRSELNKLEQRKQQMKKQGFDTMQITYQIEALEAQL